MEGVIEGNFPQLTEEEERMMQLIQESEHRLMARLIVHLTLEQKQALMWLVAHSVAHAQGIYDPQVIHIAINQDGQTPNVEALAEYGNTEQHRASAEQKALSPEKN